MYKIDSMWEATVDGLMSAVSAKRSERWMACSALWLSRQGMYSAGDYWLALASYVLSQLPSAEQEQVKAGTRKEEDAAITAPGTDWPEIPSAIQGVIDGWQAVPAVEADLDALKAAAIEKVDRAAEAYRMNFITPGFGQVMTYQQKLAEARALLADATIADAEIPHIVAEAAATGKTKEEVAQEIVTTFESWQALSASIEGKRMAAKAAITAAETVEAVNAAASVNWQGE